MGVMGTVCQICGMPVQHDHYVGEVESGLIGIYRGHGTSTYPPVFPFAREHEWLQQAVAVPGEDGETLARGFVEDGSLTDAAGDTYFVLDGYDEHGAFHEACWRLAGLPTTYEELRPVTYLHELTYLKRYQGQLFDFQGLQADGKDWMLLDPDLPAGQRNRARIEALLRKGMGAMPEGNAETAAELRASELWAYEPTGNGHWRYRLNFDRSIMTSAFPIKLWVKLPVAEGPQLELWESEFLGAEDVILLATESTEGQVRFYAYARSPEAAERACQAPGAELELAEELGWASYFDEVAPRIPGLA